MKIMDDTLSPILKDCPNKIEIMDSVGKINHSEEFSKAIREYLNEQFNSKQKLTTLYQQCLQDKFNVETKYSTLKVEYNEKDNKIEHQTKQISKLESDLNVTISKIDDIRNEYEKKFDSQYITLQREYESLKSSNSLLISEKNELLTIISRKDVHIQQLDDQWKENVEKLKKSNVIKSELQAKLDEYTQNGTLNEWRRKLVLQQSEIYENQIKQHLETISSQSNDIVKLKKQNSEQILKIQTIEDNKATEITHLNDTVNNLRKHLENMQVNYNKLIEKVSHNESLMNMEKLELEKEVNSSHRLCELLTEEKNDLTNTINKHREIQNELIHRVNQLEKDNSKLMDNYNENSKLWNENVHNYESKIKSLQDELIVAQTIVESSRINDIGYEECIDRSAMSTPDLHSNDDSVINKFLSPLAKRTSQLLKDGLSITQIYTEYNKSLNKIEDLKSEITKLSTHLNSTIKKLDIQNNENVQLREEKNRCELYADHLSKNVIETNSVVVAMEEKITNLENEMSELLEQKITLTQLSKDLSTQIRNFLVPNDTTTNNNDNNQLDFNIMDSNYMTKVEDVIESTLAFRTVEQLQNQNMKLLVLVKNLKSKTETLTVDPKTEEEYENKLKLANDRINSLTEELAKISNIYETTRKQLDIYNVANGTSYTQEPPTSAINCIPMENSKNSQSFEIIREQYQELLNNKMELLNETRLEVSRLNDHTNNLKSRISQLESQLQNTEEQRIHAVNTLEHETREYLLKEEKVIQVDLLNKQLKESINFYKNQYDELSEKMNNLEKAHRAICDENIHLRETSKFLESQIDNHNTQTNNFGQLLSCIQDIQNNLEYRENTSEIKLLKYVDELKAETKSLRFQLKDTLENNENQYHIDLQKLRYELEQKDDTINKLLNHENELRTKLNEIKSNVVTDNGTSSQVNVNETIENLNEQLLNYKKQVNQLLAISAAAEENLENNVAVWNECKIKLETEISELKSSIVNKNNEIEKFNCHTMLLESKINEKDMLINEFETQQNVKVEPILQELNMMKEREKSWGNTKTQLNDLLKQLREKYEMELIGHADDITSLKEMTRKYEDMEKKVYNSETELKNLKCKIDSLQSEYNSKIGEYELAIDDRKNLQRSILEQNNILGNQVDSLMKQIMAVKDKNVPIDSINITTDGNKNVEELWELIKYLRRDKDVLEARLESQKSESMKYKIKCERLETGCQNLEASLMAERSILNDSNCMIDQAVKLKDLELSNSQLNGKSKELESHCVSLQEQLQACKCEAKELKDKLSKQDILTESSSREVDNFKTQISYLEKICSELNIKISESNKLNDELKIKLATVSSKELGEKSKIEMFNIRLSRLSDEISVLKNKLSEVNIEKNGVIAEKENQINAIKEENNSLKEKLTSLDSALKTSINRNQTLHKIALHLKDEMTRTKTSDSDSKDIHTQGHSDVADEIDKNFNDYKEQNLRLEEEIKVLKSKLAQLQDIKSNATSDSTTKDQNDLPNAAAATTPTVGEDKLSDLSARYEKLNHDYNLLKQRHELLSKHTNEIYKKTDATKLKNMGTIKPPTADVIKPIIPIRDRISDTPINPGDSQYKKTSINRISPPSNKNNSSQLIINEELASNTDCIEQNGLPLPKETISTQIDEKLFSSCVNSSSTPMPLQKTLSDISDPSLFSQVKPSDVSTMNTTTDTNNISIINSSFKVPTSKITSQLVEKTPIRRSLNRSLVRRKTPLVTTISPHLHNSIGSVIAKTELKHIEDNVISDNHIELSPTKLQSITDSIKPITTSESLCDDDSVHKMFDDSHFKRPLKRNNMETNISTDIFIDDDLEFNPKRINFENCDEKPTLSISSDVQDSTTCTPQSSSKSQFSEKCVESNDQPQTNDCTKETETTLVEIPSVRLRRSPLTSESNIPSIENNITEIDDKTIHSNDNDNNNNNILPTSITIDDTDPSKTDDNHNHTSSN